MSDMHLDREEERDFLLDNLRQLEAEHESGAITDVEYIELRDQQTVRAAAVLRELATEEPIVEVEADEPKKQFTVPKSRRVWLIGAAAFVVIAGGLLISSISDRTGNETTTGSISADSNTLLAKASEQTAKGHPADAVKTYDDVLKKDPTNPAALAYKGWLVRLAGLPDQGLQSINAAVSAHPEYPDAHFFKGFILLRDRNDPTDAITEFNAFMNNNPPQAMVSLVQQALDDAKAQAAAAAAKK